MKKLSFFSRWLHKSAILLAVIAVFSSAVYAQSNYLSIFGNPYCATCCGGGTNSYSFNCQVSPPVSSSFNSIPFLYDPVYGGGSDVSNYQNSCYDLAGDLLFSVNQDGIYDPYGNYLFGFGLDPSGYSVTLPYTIPCGGTGGTTTLTLYPTFALSEVAIFPVPSRCNAYYVVFWCGLSNTQTFAGVTYPAVCIRAIEVDLTSSFGIGGSGATSTWYNFTDGVIDAPQCDGGNDDWNYFLYPTVPRFGFAIAADGLSADGSRDVYLVNPSFDRSGNYTELFKLNFQASGGLPNIANVTDITSIAPISTSLLPVESEKAKLFTISGDKCFTYISGGINAYELVTCDVTNSNISEYPAPEPSGYSAQSIYGFEYLNMDGEQLLLMSYQDDVLPTMGGLAYVTPITAGIATLATDVSAVSTAHYLHSDMEFDTRGDLLLNYDDLSGNMSLAYLPSTALTSSFTATEPNLMPGTSGTCNISLANQGYTTTNIPVTSWYIGNQIRGNNCPTAVTLSVTPTSCTGVAPVFTATSVSACDATYSWYKSLGGTNPFSLYANCVGCNVVEDPDASNSEEMYCVVNIPSSTYQVCYTPETLTSNIVIVHSANLQIANVDINTLCIPGTGSAPNPVYSVTVTGGSNSYSYSWSPSPVNSTTLNNSTLTG